MLLCNGATRKSEGHRSPANCKANNQREKVLLDMTAIPRNLAKIVVLGRRSTLLISHLDFMIYLILSHFCYWEDFFASNLV